MSTKAHIMSTKAHMTSRGRVALALSHQEPDRPPIDLGSTAVTGAHVSVIYALRQRLKLDPPGTPVKVVEPYQMLGEVGDDLLGLLGIDFVPLRAGKTIFGFENRGWRPWTTFDGTPVLVPEAFNTTPERSGDILMYPEGDRSAPPSGRMPKGGFYFDAIIRQPPIDESKLRVEDNLEEFTPVSDEALRGYQSAAEAQYRDSQCALVGNFGGTAFGDIALVPAPFLKHPKGIRDVEEWYISTMTRREHVREIFNRQCEIALKNLPLIHQAVGEKIAVVFISGTDFGAQNAPFISPAAYRDLFQPFHKRINGWVHSHTSWKTFCHSCGSIEALIPDLIEGGFDILNPVQCSAAHMEPELLKSKYGQRVCFWGGLVNTQKTLPFGTPQEVTDEVRSRLKIFAPGGGYVANPIHNVQAGCPVENVLAAYRAVQA